MDFLFLIAVALEGKYVEDCFRFVAFVYSDGKFWREFRVTEFRTARDGIIVNLKIVENYILEFMGNENWSGEFQGVGG